MKIVAVVPVKEFGLAKSRLSNVLVRTERANLARAMLLDVITQLKASDQLSEIALVGEGNDVRAVCQRAGLHYLKQRGLTLNDAVGTGVEWAREIRADAILVLSSDLPMLTLEDIKLLLGGHRGQGIAIGPAEHDGGTNALLQAPVGLITPCFGEDSFRRHLEQARRMRYPARIVSSSSIASDIDRPEDLTLLLSRKVGAATREFVRQTGIARRIQTQTPV